jgi:hypothetical protein
MLRFRRAVLEWGYGYGFLLLGELHDSAEGRDDIDVDGAIGAEGVLEGHCKQKYNKMNKLFDLSA